MKIGIIVDGQGEFASLPKLLAELKAATGASILNPLFEGLQPLATPQRIAEQCRRCLAILEKRGCDTVVILIDREGRTECPGRWAAVLENEISKFTSDGVAVRVVVKDRTFENWLAADFDALAGLRGRFTLTDADRNRVAPNKADHVDCYALLNRACRKGYYDKVADAGRILEVATVEGIAANSRSFRRLLRVLGHPSYVSQSRLPG